MTKTLTEQWHDGKLPEDTYYVRFICGRYGVYEFEQYKGFGFDNDLAYIKEVLAPVPSYEEWKHTKEKLKKATELNCNHAYKTNKRRTQINNLKNENNQLREQLKEKNIKLNELRHQRNEANEVIKLYAENMKQGYPNFDGTYTYDIAKKIDDKRVALARTISDPRPADEYLEKWGVK